jgi:NAD(P)H-dependent FMN reductase
MSKLARTRNSLPRECNSNLQTGQSNTTSSTHPNHKENNRLTDRLPVYNGDLETNVPQAVLDFKKQVASADGIIICTPEYNWS